MLNTPLAHSRTGWLLLDVAPRQLAEVGARPVPPSDPETGYTGPAPAKGPRRRACSWCVDDRPPGHRQTALARFCWASLADRRGDLLASPAHRRREQTVCPR